MTTFADAPEPPAHTAEVSTADADRLVRLLGATAWRPSASEIQRHYLDAGSGALLAFDEQRIGGADALARALETQGWAYRQAIRWCLPAARSMAGRVPGLLAGIAGRLGQSETPQVAFVFGAGRSAGTVQEGVVILALEVVCRDVHGASSAEDVLKAFLLHEAVHVYQLAAWRPGRTDNLLRQAMMEGFADLLAGEAFGGELPQERERAAWGRAHEADLWEDFQRDMRGVSLGSWMYGPGPSGAPADLGYWIGKRISAAYLDAAPDRAAALAHLLALDDPEALLKVSGYGQDLPSPGARP